MKTFKWEFDTGPEISQKCLDCDVHQSHECLSEILTTTRSTVHALQGSNSSTNTQFALVTRSWCSVPRVLLKASSADHRTAELNLPAAGQDRTAAGLSYYFWHAFGLYCRQFSDSRGSHWLRKTSVQHRGNQFFCRFSLESLKMA